jgi:hypothetical protein
VATIALFTLGTALPRVSVPGAFASPVTAAYVRQARFVAGMIGPGRIAPALPPSPVLDPALEPLAGADVLLIFVESYGAVAFEEPAVAAPLEPARDRLAAAVAATGRHSMSAYMDAPTFGGSSWLAHLSVLSGVDVRDQYAYTALMASGRDTVVKAFSRRGYRTVALMPGMRQAWPEGAFYGFDVIYGRDRLDYRGPQFGWWSIPDQYALARLDALERLRRPRPPVFAVFPTSTTHAPFGPVPPYQPEWPRILTANPFDDGEVDAAMSAAPDLMNLRAAYVRAMTYEYESFAGYLLAHADDDLVVILIGDHQPAAAVTGPGASWRVPLHVITRSGDIAKALAARGLRPGLRPLRPSIGSMHGLAPVLFDAFGGDTVGARDSGLGARDSKTTNPSVAKGDTPLAAAPHAR